jgi:hypothetical protein
MAQYQCHLTAELARIAAHPDLDLRRAMVVCMSPNFSNCIEGRLLPRLSYLYLILARRLCRRLSRAKNSITTTYIG